jgi:G3E family GTPase
VADFQSRSRQGLQALAAVPEQPISLSVLTGFLGSGKTTFLGRVLASPDLADTAVVISEFGAVALDHLLIEAESDGIVDLPNGCTCCAVKQGLADTLYRLVDRRRDSGRPPFRRIALETSGLADPAPILYTLSADAYLEASLRLDRVVTTIDTIAGLASLAHYPEAAAQAASADLLVLTKTDLAPAKPALMRELAALNAIAPIVDGATIDAAATLFGGAPVALPRPRLRAEAIHGHGITSLCLALRRPMSRFEFAFALGRLAQEHGEKLLRVKGLIEFADGDGRPAAIHAVQHTMYPPRWLADWPDGDHTSRLVFIVRDLAPETILGQFMRGEPAIIEAARGEA